MLLGRRGEGSRMETDPTVRPGTPGRHRVHAGNDVSVPKVVVDVRPSPIPIHSHCLQVKGEAVVRRHYCLIEARCCISAATCEWIQTRVLC